MCLVRLSEVKCMGRRQMRWTGLIEVGMDLVRLSDV